MKKENRSYCPECRQKAGIEIKKVMKDFIIKDKKYSFDVTIAQCTNCHEEINIAGILDVRAAEIDEQYRTCEDIVTIDEINDLMEVYKIGKAPLSLALGFKETTLSRYLQGQIPSKEYSDIMKKALKSYDYMKEQANRNKAKISDAAYRNLMCVISDRKMV